MWRTPLSLIAGSADVNVTITSDTLIGNLWTYLGSPSGPQTVTVTVDNADIGDVQVTADWAGGSTFQFNAINGGRILGLGGDGGAGGDDNGATGTSGSHGGDGGAALSGNGFVLNIDIDGGFLLGGAGGGGGGSYDDLGASGDPGGGGGGGQGFSVTSGGAAGMPTGIPVASDGVDGGQGGPGAGGSGGGTNAGATGGGWGEGGISGVSTALSLTGGIGGRAGSAYLSTNGSTLVFNGAKSEATLITELRLIGESGAGFALMKSKNNNTAGGTAATSTGGFTFQINGDLLYIDSLNGDVTSTLYWFGGTGAPTTATYEVRSVSGTEYGNDSWTATGAAAGTWVDLDSPRTWSITNTGQREVQQQFEIRRVGSGGILESGILRLFMESP